MARPVTPPVAADVIIELVDRPDRPVVLVRRGHPPYGWALPGGFVEVGETVEAAAAREALEETGLEIADLELVGVYSDPDRDPRGHTVSVVFSATASGAPRGGDDAAEAAPFALGAWPELAFDHARILSDWLARRAARHDPGGAGPV